MQCKGPHEIQCTQYKRIQGGKEKETNPENIENVEYSREVEEVEKKGMSEKGEG